MEKMTLDRLQHSTQHAKDIETELGKPLYLINYVTEAEGSSISSDMKIAVSPSGSIVVKSNWDKAVHVLSSASSVKFETRLSYLTGDATDQHLAVSSNGSILLKAYGRNIDHDNTPNAAIYVVCFEEIDVEGQRSAREKWKHLVSPKDSAHPAEQIRCPIITNDTVYIAYEDDSDGHACLCALALNDGRVMWNKSYPGLYFGQPVMGNSNHFYVPFRKHDEKFNTFYGIMELSDRGEILGNIDGESSNNKLSVISIGAGGDIFSLSGIVQSNAAFTTLSLYKFSRSGGGFKKKLLMSFPENFEFNGSAIIIGPEDTLYIPTICVTRPPQQAPSDEYWSSKIWSIDSDGKTQWQHDLYGYAVSSPVITEEGTLYLSCLRNPAQTEKLRWMTTGEVHAINLKSGAHRWITSISGIETFTGNVSVHPLLTAPVLGLDGTVYVGAEITEQTLHDPGVHQNLPTHSCLIALRAHEQLATSAAWPIEHGNASCSGLSPLWPR